MTVAEMIIGVNIGVQKVDSNAYDNLLEEEILYYLNKANREYIRRQTVYLKENLKVSNRHDFISDVEASENLSSLIVTDVIALVDISASSNYDNAVVIDMSDLTYTMFSFVFAQVTFDSSVGKKACKLISPSEIHVYLKTAYNDPLFRRCPIVISNNNILIFFGFSDGSISEADIVYIKNPATLVESAPGAGEVSTSELPIHTHDDIVDLTVSMIMEDFKSARPYEQNQKTLKGEEV